MINRELIRIKIVQLTYAYYQNGNNNLENAEKELLYSLDKAYDLYNYLLDLIVAITDVAAKRTEIAINRHNRGEGPMPSTRLAMNKFAAQLKDNDALAKWRETQRSTWTDDVTTVQDTTVADDSEDEDDNVLGEGENQFTFKVVDKEGNETVFTVNTDKKIVGEALLDLGLIEGEDGDFGLYVKKVNGILADYDVDQTYWAFYVNGEYAMSGVDTTTIENGAEYSFKVEK